MTERERRVAQDLWVTLGLVVTAASAAVSSFAGLRGLAVVAGWPVWLAWLLPLTIDAYAMTATRVWLAESTRSAKARGFARVNAIGAILMSLAGNGVYHLVAAKLLPASWVIVVAVGAVPALVLGLVSHLAVLRTQAGLGTAQVVSEAVPVQASRTQDGPRYASEDELLDRARAADSTHRAAYGRGISRDALRRELRIGGTRATALLRQLKTETPQETPVKASRQTA